MEQKQKPFSWDAFWDEWEKDDSDEANGTKKATKVALKAFIRLCKAVSARSSIVYPDAMVDCIGAIQCIWEPIGLMVRVEHISGTLFCSNFGRALEQSELVALLENYYVLSKKPCELLPNINKSAYVSVLGMAPSDLLQNEHWLADAHAACLNAIQPYVRENNRSTVVRYLSNSTPFDLADAFAGKYSNGPEPPQHILDEGVVWARKVAPIVCLTCMGQIGENIEVDPDVPTRIRTGTCSAGDGTNNRLIVVVSWDDELHQKVVQTVVGEMRHHDISFTREAHVQLPSVCACDMTDPGLVCPKQHPRAPISTSFLQWACYSQWKH